MRVLVTGGAGFIGSAVCRLLIAEIDWRLVNLDLLTYAASQSSLASVADSDHYMFIRGDIADTELVQRLFNHHAFDAVIHLAAESHVDRSITNAHPFITTNIVGVFSLLQAALQHWEGLESEAKLRFRFLHVSTDEVFGSLGATSRFAETSRYDPRPPYSASKAAGDHLVSAWGSTYGLPVLISNCSNNYGPYHFPEKFIPRAILNALEGKAIPIYGDGAQVRDWLYVEDHARVLKLILECGEPGETYNVDGDNERTNLQVVESLCALLDARRPDLRARRLITFVQDRPGHDHRYAIDASKIRTKLGWSPRLDFDQGLASTVDCDVTPVFHPAVTRVLG